MDKYINQIFFKDKNTTLKNEFDLKVMNYKNHGFDISIIIIALKTFEKIRFVRLNGNEAANYIKDNYDKNFVNKYIPFESVVGFTII